MCSLRGDGGRDNQETLYQRLADTQEHVSTQVWGKWQHLIPRCLVSLNSSGQGLHLYHKI